MHTKHHNSMFVPADVSTECICAWSPEHVNNMCVHFIAPFIYMRLCITVVLRNHCGLYSSRLKDSSWWNDIMCHLCVKCLYLRQSPLMERGCQTSDHVWPSPLERLPIHLDHLENKLKKKCEQQMQDVAIIVKWLSAQSAVARSKNEKKKKIFYMRKCIWHEGFLV